MTVLEMAKALDAKILTAATDTTREVRCGYACDLLSWVMAHGSEGMAWISVQTHMNVIAVATLHDMSCVIVPENIAVDADVIAKADEEGIAVLSSPMTAYELSGRMFALQIPAC